MSKIVWDETGKRFYETGVDHGVLFVKNEEGAYGNGVAWNGLINVNESPTGAEPNPLYADCPHRPKQTSQVQINM